MPMFYQISRNMFFVFQSHKLSDPFHPFSGPKKVQWSKVFFGHFHPKPKKGSNASVRPKLKQICFLSMEKLFDPF